MARIKIPICLSCLRKVSVNGIMCMTCLGIVHGAIKVRS